MKKITEEQEGFSKVIPNPAGVPVAKVNSNEMRKEHNRWKKEVRKKKKERSLEGLNYWQVASACVTL